MLGNGSIRDVRVLWVTETSLITLSGSTGLACTEAASARAVAEVEGVARGAVAEGAAAGAVAEAEGAAAGAAALVIWRAWGMPPVPASDCKRTSNELYVDGVM